MQMLIRNGATAIRGALLWYKVPKRSLAVPTCREAHISSSHRISWIFAIAGGSMAAALLTDCSPASCDGARDSKASGDEDLSDLKKWLQDHGVDMKAVDIKRSQAADGAGLGLFMSQNADKKQIEAYSASRSSRRWWWPFHSSHIPQEALVSFPLNLAITASNIIRDHSLGRSFAWMLERGVVDERTSVMVFLMVERLKGAASSYSPWINTLPKTFDTPIMFNKEELAELNGTPLHRAVSVVSSRLHQLWSQLQPALDSMLIGQAVSRQAQVEDLLWAYNVFWSRAQSLPVPKAGSASRLLARDPHAVLQIQEGIIPGLDFCNHHVTAPSCWWEVTAPDIMEKGDKEKGDQPSGNGEINPTSVTVQLRLYKGARAKPGQELFISYGDKSNEELLMLYGFAVPGNPNDHVMVHCPLPHSSTWDDVMHARVDLIRVLKLDLQFFLPSLVTKSNPGPEHLPLGLLDTLEVFILSPSELLEKLSDAKKSATPGGVSQTSSPARSLLDISDIKKKVGSMSPSALSEVSHLLGLRMGALATLVRILEGRIEEQEGDSGTGTLEQDEQLLRQAVHGSLSSSQLRKHACVVYRCEQKRIVRDYLGLARKELQELLSVMTDISDKLTKTK